jgi:dienelactone hydrolase
VASRQAVCDHCPEEVGLVDLQVRGTERRATAQVDDVVVDGQDGLDVEAYIVRPIEPISSSATGPGLVMWHWLDTEAPDGNRTQYLDEAVELAGAGVVSVLPQGQFPWAMAPTGAPADVTEINAEAARLRMCLDVLTGRRDVDAARLGIVGHDFGGMVALVAAADDPRARALVVVAAAPRWGDWFLTFWPIEDDRNDYLRLLRPLDPVERIRQVSGPPVLLQFAERDYYIALMSARELQRAGPEGTELLTYDTGHDMRLPEIRADRRAFLARTLGFGEPTGSTSTMADDQAATT